MKNNDPSLIEPVSGGLQPGNLHHYWDVEFVQRLGADPPKVAASLIGQISENQRQVWSSGKPADWAMQAFMLGRGMPMDCCRNPAANAYIRFLRHAWSKPCGMWLFGLVGPEFALPSF